jgi:hypothetical protein
VVLVLGLVVAGYFVWKNLSGENQQLRTEVTEFKKLTDTLVRSSNKWVTKNDLETQLEDMLTKSDLTALREDLKKLDARLTAVGRTIGTIKGRIAKIEASDREGQESQVEKCADGKLVDTHGYTKNPQIKDLRDSNSAPVAEVEFNAVKDKPWSYEVYERRHRLTTVIGKQNDGQLSMYHKLEYSVPKKDPEKNYTVDLISSEYVQVPLKNQMFWLNPILDLNFFVGGRVYGFGDLTGRSDSLLAIGADVGLSLSSYGETKADSWFRLFRIGVGYDVERQGAHFSFAPFAFNVGKPLPLLTNMYLSPQVGVDTAGGLTVGLGIGPAF